MTDDRAAPGGGRGRRGWLRRSVALSLGCLTLTLAATGPAGAHFISHDSVDGCEIRWEDETRYDTERQWAQARWEALKGSDNCVDLAPDAWNTSADLEWKDAYRSDVSWAGLYQAEFGADDIHLNRYYMEKSWYTDCMRKWVAMHELGHAHGLGHSYSGQIMNAYVQNVCTLQSHDIADYRKLWG